jgi:glyoxylase-like metal-dependent hydrolase (beta-lactamase superfamily II)
VNPVGIAPGLRRWTAWHDEWQQQVGSVVVETRDEVVLIDPLVPREDADEVWATIERGKPVHVLVTVFWHTRSTATVVERTAASVWAPSRGRAAIARRAGSVDRPFRPCEPLPGGVVAVPTARANEVVYAVPGHAAVVPGDVLLGAKTGALRLCPASWFAEGIGEEELRRSLRPLLDYPVERVLVSDGEPVLRDAHGCCAAYSAPRAAYTSS